MGRHSTFPTLFDEARQLSISDLKRLGYLKPDSIKKGLLHWADGGISVLVDTRSDSPFVELNYLFNDKHVRYKIDLTTIQSNLNRGVIWRFFCPQTHKRCRTLYLSPSGYFVHREACGGLYKIQQLSKKQRHTARILRVMVEANISIDNFDKERYKHTYAGKPTRRHLKDLKRIELGSVLAISDVLKP